MIYMQLIICSFFRAITCCKQNNCFIVQSGQSATTRRLAALAVIFGLAAIWHFLNTFFANHTRHDLITLLLVILFSVCCVLTFRNKRFIFDTTTRQLSIVEQTFFGSSSKIITFEEIEGLSLNKLSLELMLVTSEGNFLLSSLVSAITGRGMGADTDPAYLISMTKKRENARQQVIDEAADQLETILGRKIKKFI